MESLYKKIPDLENQGEVYVSGNILRHLTDEEFVYLWYMPNINLLVSNKTKEYVEKRRWKLGLIKTVPDAS